jgi:hypothetical protein
MMRAVPHAQAGPLLVPATGYEVGTKMRFFDPLELSLAVYRLDLAARLTVTAYF